MDSDLNKYDLNHRVSHHPKMSDAAWEESYRAAWEAFYDPEHVRTILRRAAASGLGRPKTTLTTLSGSSWSVPSRACIRSRAAPFA